jgi:hypothetical protein
MAFYVHMATRGSKTTDSPRNALNYIAHGHDDRRVSLEGFGKLASERDERQLADRFEESCQPYHDPRARLGYKSITLTLPKEVSLYADKHRDQATAAIAAAVPYALDRAFSGFHYSAIAAIHNRNRDGQVHYYAHVLVGKFAQKVDTGRTFSLNGAAAGNSGRARLKELKLGWQEGIEKEFRQRLNLGIEQATPHGPVALVLPDGTRLEPLPQRDQLR